MTKRELKKLFRDYPDLVRLPELCAMMGGIGESTARKLLCEGHIRSIMVRSTYYIPKGGGKTPPPKKGYAFNEHPFSI